MKCRIGRTLTVLCIVVCLVLCTMLATGSSVHAAGVATDTLTVKIGYWGMKEDTFVEKGTYHWTELDGSMGGALDSHKVAYSFYRQDDEGNYSTVIDSARGFYIMDLLDYANVDTSMISSIFFYTKDQTVGYFTSFTYNELFSTERYYFEDLAGHLTPEYDDNGKFKGVKVKSSAWSDKVRVQPMLALIIHWNVDVSTSGGDMSDSGMSLNKQADSDGSGGDSKIDKKDAVSFDESNMEEKENTDNLSKDGGMDKLGEVYYDEATGKYYVIKPKE